MARASVQDQWRLLDVQAHDVRLSQLAHREKTLPEYAELDALAAERRAADDQVVLFRTRTEDLTRQVAKAEDDVEQVRRRVRLDEERLNSGQGSAKDLQALQHEVGTLAERQRVLEDVELDVMEQLEQAQSDLEQGQASAQELEQAETVVRARRDAALAVIAQERAQEQAAREAAAAGIPGELMALYERIRSAGGVGAAALGQRRCGGCRLELNAHDLGRLREAAEDDIVRCEECGCILVRTAESGL